MGSTRPGLASRALDALIHFIDRNIAQSRSDAYYVAQESERRAEQTMALETARAAADHQAAQDAAATQLALQHAAVQQRTSAAAEHLADDP